MNVLGALIFVVAILLSIVLHEAGHMVCARLAGGKVTEFFVGFGSRLWSFRRGETEYGIKAIPAGGYVKIVGMTDLDEVEPGDEGRALRDKPARWRLLTLSAGSLTHFAIAFLIFFFVAVVAGIPQAQTAPKVGTVAACMTADGSTVGCNPATDPSPAKKAGLVPGDEILQVDGHSVSTYSQLTDVLHALPADKPATLVYRTPQGELRKTTVEPVHVPAVTYSDGTTKPGSLIGMTGASYTQHSNPVSGLAYAGSFWGQMFVDNLKGLGDIPGSLPGLFTSTVHHTQRPADAPSSVVGAAQVAGDLFSSSGFTGLLEVVALVNMFIGIFNLLPLLPLDGGHIAILLYNEARKRVYRLRRKPEPARVDLNKLMPVAYVVLLAFGALMILLLAADLFNPMQLPG